jgi:hypothetical protein
MQIRDTPAEIQDYFTFFASEPNLRVSGYQPFVRTFGDFAINSGEILRSASTHVTCNQAMQRELSYTYNYYDATCTRFDCQNS